MSSDHRGHSSFSPAACALAHRKGGARGESLTSPLQVSQGILPYSQSTFSHRADFPLVGSGESYEDCGRVFAVGCLNVEGHKGMNLDGIDMTGKAVVKYVRNSCHRPLCPECWPDWANRECDNAVRRLNAFVLKKANGKRLKPIHVIVSVPIRDYELSLQEMRRKAYKALKKVGLFGGVLIYHPKRKRKAVGWYFSPHFHVVGYGWIHNVRRNYVHSSYVVKNVGVRKSVRGTLYYQLSHCGIPEKLHSVTWFGALSYNQLKVPRIKDEPQICPLCGQRLRRLVWCGEEPNILDRMHQQLESGFYFEEPEFWRYKQQVFESYGSLPEGCEILAGSY